MEFIKCRTCLRLAYKYDCSSINTRCYLEETVKEAILRLVPEMNLTLQDNDSVCENCVITLKTTLRFIATCLRVESLITVNKNISNTLIEIPENDIKVEDIEIIINQIDVDHDYHVKQELLNESCRSSNENNEDACLFEEIKIQPFLNVDANDSYDSINTDSESPIKIIIEEPSSPIPSTTEENIRLEFFSETAYSSDHSDFQEVEKTVSDHIKCPICLAIVFDKEEYEKHLQTHVLVCEFCEEDFSNGRENEFKAHLDHHKKHTAICEFCGRIFQDFASLKKHRISNHSSSPCLCDKCPKSFATKHLLYKHMNAVHTRQKQCLVCEKVFVNVERYKSHYRLVHLKLKPFLCAICGKQFGRNDYLEKHKIEHEGQDKIRIRAPKIKTMKRIPRHGMHLKSPGTPVECNICGKKVSTVHLLKTHLETHLKIRRYKCSHCDLTFSMLNNKRRHEKLHEKDGENKYRCDICWKWVQTREQLDNHVKSHDRPPQHPCPICGERFHRRYLLDNHVADKHTSEEDVEQAVKEIVVKNLLPYVNPNIKIK